MPLTLKSLREVSNQLGIPEAEIRALVDMNKVRAVYKSTGWMFAPDEVAKIERQRRTLPESIIRSSAIATANQAKPPQSKKPPQPKKPPAPPSRGR